MVKGINIATPEAQHDIYSLLVKQPSQGTVKRDRICVFISHKDIDTQAAIEIGNHIMEDLGLNIYLDVYDKSLQAADKEGDLEGIVASIQKGVSYASHLLCVISDKSQDSWWMPYEIGFAQAYDIKTSSIIVKETEHLPTYLRIKDSPVFFDIKSFDEYMVRFISYGGLFTNQICMEPSREFAYFNRG